MWLSLDKNTCNSTWLIPGMTKINQIFWIWLKVNEILDIKKAKKKLILITQNKIMYITDTNKQELLPYMETIQLQKSTNCPKSLNYIE